MHDLLKSIAEQTDSTELFHLDTTVDLVGFENNRLKFLNTLHSNGVAIRAIVDGRLGQAFASDLRNPADLGRHLRDIALLGDHADYEFAGAADYPALDLMDDSVKNLTPAEMLADGQAAVDELVRYDDRLMVSFTGERTLDRVHVMTTEGADAAFQRMFYSFGIITELVEGKNILRLAKFTKGIKRPKPAIELARQMIEEIKVARKTVSFKPGKHRVILAPSALADILMAFTGSVDGDLVAKGVSPLAKRLGEQVLDPRITILDDPTHPDGIMSAPVDDEGTPCRRKAVIEHGVLRSFLADRKAAARLGIHPTGNGFRAIPFEKYKSFTAGVATDFSNLIMEPGDVPLNTLFRDTDLGIEVHQVNGILLGDLIGGDFSGSLEIAYLVRNGERVGRIKNAMIAGNFFQIFKHQLVDISRERVWTGTFGGCSGALLLPWVVVHSVEISGT